jgi:transposase
MPQFCLQSIQIPLPCEPFRVKSSEFTNGELHIRFAREAGDEGFGLCPHCGDELHPHQRRQVSLRAVPVNGIRKVFWDVEHMVCHCRNCDAYITQDIPFRFGPMRCTTFLAKEICSQLDMQNMNVVAVSRILGLSWDRVKNVHREYLRLVNGFLPPPEGPELAVVDEFSIERGQTYATLVINGATKETLYVEKGKSKESFEPFFSRYSPEFYGRIEAFAMDQNAQYNIVVRKHLPAVPVVADYFHMLKNFSDSVLDKVRLRAARSCRNEGDKDSYWVWKRSKRLLSTRFPSSADDIPDLQTWSAQQSLIMLMDQNKEMDTCIHMRENLQKMYETCRDRASMKKNWDSWCAMASVSEIKELAAFAENKRRFEDEILSHAEHPFSSGVIEGCMNKIKAQESRLRLQGLGLLLQADILLLPS